MKNKYKVGDLLQQNHGWHKIALITDILNEQRLKYRLVWVNMHEDFPFPDLYVDEDCLNEDYEKLPELKARLYRMRYEQE